MSDHPTQDPLEQAWGIIANASDWNMPERAEWRRAAEVWRDTVWHPYVSVQSDHEPSTHTVSNFGEGVTE